MSVEKFVVKGKHSLDLACIKIVPKKEPKGIIQIFHGMGEYKDRYIHFMEYLAEQGYAVYAHDHRKHGESLTAEGKQGIWLKEDRFDDVIDDCYFVTRKILRDYPGGKICIFGHSMGSIIARAYLSRYALVPKAAVIMGTLPPMKMTKAFLPLMIARVIGLFSGSEKRSNFLANTLNKPMLKNYEEPRTNLDWLSRDEELVDSYIADPLCGYAYTAQFYKEFFKMIVEVNKSDFILETKDIPMLFISGKADPVGNNGEGIEDIFRTFNGHGFTQLTLKLIEDARHEVLNETDKLSTYEIIGEWLKNSL